MSQERSTMLNSNDLNLIDLSDESLYRLEVIRLPDISKLSEEQRQRLVARARAQEEQACTDLLLCCLGYVLRYAGMIREYHQPSQDVFDLAQEGNLAMLEGLKNALASNNPIDSLCQCAQRAMRRPARSASSKDRGRRR
jgi:DNA-directed RNA polymerase sigma subunit (sigma70/sigma32)